MLGDKFEYRIEESNESNQPVFRLKVKSQIRDAWLCVARTDSWAKMKRYCDAHNINARREYINKIGGSK